MTVLAIDAGTTGVTALLVTPEGTRRRPWLPGVRPALPAAGLGRARARGHLAGRARGRRAGCLAPARRAGASERVGITNQRETVVLWDRETLGAPRRAIVWQDRRTADLCARLRDAGHEDRVTELTGLRLDPYFSGTKLRWLAEHEPHTWARVRRPGRSRSAPSTPTWSPG